MLADYTSTDLDLSNPTTFRDLSKPMGGQDPGRAAEYRRRYDEWLEPDPEHPTPRFHYATHYSSAAAVNFYLVRLEPFTSAHVRLQGGKIDHADRLFTSVAGSWDSASRASLSDVKELTPEFFYLPDFLLNGNKLDLGVRQRSGAAVGDVQLPPWAHGSAEEFVRRHRQALESDYVSAHLHEWIDLIFGYKQRGPASVAALNVFHHLTYEGAVDVDAITDPVEKMSTIAQILNFGQTPTQLLLKPHPPRDQPRCIGIPSRLLLVAGPDAQVPETALEGAGLGPVREIVVGADGRLTVAYGQSALCPITPGESVRWGYADGGLRHVLRSDRTALQREVTRVVGVSRCLHFGGITCAAYSDDGTLLVTGGAGGDLAIWEAARYSSRDSTRPWPSIRSGGNKGASGTSGGATSGTGLVRLLERLSGHVGRVTCVAVCKGSGVAVSSGADRTVLMWDLNRLRFIRQLATCLPDTPRALSISESGAVVLICSGTDLLVVGINGAELARTTTDVLEDYFMCAVALPSPDWAVESPMLYTGHPSGALRLWRLVPSTLSMAPSASGAVSTSPVSTSTFAMANSSAAQQGKSGISLSAGHVIDSEAGNQKVQTEAVADISKQGDTHSIAAEPLNSCSEESASTENEEDCKTSYEVDAHSEQVKSDSVEMSAAQSEAARSNESAPGVSETETADMSKRESSHSASVLQPDTSSRPLQLELITTCSGRAVLEFMPNSGGSGRFASHGAGLTAIAFSPDGSALYTGDESGRVIRWDTGHRDRLRWNLKGSPSFWLSV